MRNKLNFFVLFLILASANLHAQNIQLVMTPNPSPYIADWREKTETASFIISNTGGTNILVKIKTELYDGKGKLVAATDASKMPVLSVSPGVNQYNAEDIFPIYAVNYKGNFGNTILKTGRIPDDNYKICVSITNPETGAQVGTSGTVCKTFIIVAYQVPVLLNPKNNEIFQEAGTKGIVFRWTPVTPSPNMIVTYRLQVYEVLEGMDNMTVLKTSQPIVEKDVKGSLQTSWPLEFALPEVGKNYVWTITPLDDQNRKVVDGIGFAQPFAFSVPNNDNQRTAKTTNPTDSIIVATDSGTAITGDTIRAGLNGEFNVIVTEIATETDGSLTGKGKVRIKWLATYIAVEFKKIRIDSTKRLTSGGIVSTESGSSSTSYQAYPKAWAMSLLSGPGVANVVDNVMAWTNDKVTNLSDWVDNNVSVGQPKINYNDTIATPVIPDNCLKMPFGLQFNNGDQQLVITEMIFKPNESKINFLAQEEFTKSGTEYKLGFAGKYFIMHPKKIEFATGRVELAEDFTIPNTAIDPKMLFTFKKGGVNIGCYIAWADTGITDVGLGLEVSFTREWLIPVPSATTSSRVIASIAGNGSSMKDIILTGNLPNCEIVGTNGLKILADSITLDFSDIRNPSNIVFPENYADSSGDEWQGFYMKNFGITLPEHWKTSTSTYPPSIAASNVIIDDLGLTTKIKALNIFTLTSGKVANLSASLDTVEIELVSSSLVSGSAKGLVVLPISENTLANTLKYTTTFAQVDSINTLQVVIVPYQAINANVLKGKMTLEPTSNITATMSKGSLAVSVTLNGTFDWNSPDFSTTTITNTGSSSPTMPGGIKNVKIEMAFENVSLNYKHIKSPESNTLTFNYGAWSFASPQKRLANFPVTIKKVYYKSLTTQPASGSDMELLRGALMIDIVANLTDDIGGSTTMGAAFAIVFNKADIKFKPQFKGVFIEKIEVHADLSAVKIDGSLVMYNSDPIFGDGFSATLGVTFTAVSLQINALVQFGNTTYLNSNQYYRYWRAEADVILPVGIPFLTGVGFYGFGGGAFYNMESKIVQRALPDVGFKYVFTPKKSTMGFMVKATIGTMPKVETFNADVSLLAQFSSSNGLELIAFTGDFWLAVKLTDRPNAKVKGGVAVSYNFPDKIFNMQALLTINVPPAITTPAPIGFVMNINGRTNKWYYKCGIPTATNTVNVFGISLYSYLMFGNDIPTPNGFTPRFCSHYLSATGSNPNNSNVGSGGVGNSTTTGKGIATGIGIEFEKDVDQYFFTGICCCKRSWTIGGHIMAGAEINLALMDQIGCVGINGYRASGNLGLYASVNARIIGTPTQHTGSPWNCGVEQINLFKIYVGAWLEGKFPNPEYIAGSITASLSLLEGLVNLSYNQSFEKGTNCNGTQVVTANAAQEDKAGDLKNKLIQYVAPNSRYNFPITSPINVKYALVPDQVFDVAENQGDGTIKNRTFKMVITKSLEVQNTDGSWTLKTLQSKLNITGEYQYYIKPPLNTNVTQGNSQVSQTNFTTLNTNNGNTLLSTNGNFKNDKIDNPVPPPPPPNYPNPVPSPVNSLVANMEYRFVVTATLKELNGNTWVNAVTRTGAAVTETKTILFRTGAMPAVQVNNVVPKQK